MRFPTLTSALLSGLVVPGWILPAHAQSDPRGGQDLPCNEFCRAWLGPAYAGPAGVQTRAEPSGPESEMPAEARDLSPEPPRGAPARSHFRFAAREHVQLYVQRRREEPFLAEDRDFDPRRAPPARKAVALQLRRPVRPNAPVIAAVPRPEPTKPAEIASKKDSGAAAQVTGIPGEPSVRLDPDSKTLMLSMNGSPAETVRLTAAEADRLVQTVGAARAKMQPEPQQNWAFGQTVTSVYDPRWTTEAERKKGDTLLHIRDPRFGWLHYTVPRMTAQQLGNLLQKQAGLPLPAARHAEATP